MSDTTKVTTVAEPTAETEPTITVITEPISQVIEVSKPTTEKETCISRFKFFHGRLFCLV